MKKTRIPLPTCRWRDELSAEFPTDADAKYLCRSARFVGAPNAINTAFCAACPYVDHPPTVEPRALPCVHLGNTATERRAKHSPLFRCAVHGRCDPGWHADADRQDVVRCNGCADYLPRDPFGPDSRQMHERAEAFLAAIPRCPTRRFFGRGVVIAAGGDRFFASLFIAVRALRHVGCRLPIEVWYLGRHDEMPAARQALLAPYGVEFVDADRVRRKHPARILNGWELKVFAVLHSRFREVLSLDADCYPCRNPEFLFERDDYRAVGAIFWPDLAERDPRLKWSAFSVPDSGRPGSIESGQFLIDKRTCWRPLNLAWFYNDHSDFYYRYAHGDKHTFEVAWTRCEHPYVMWRPRSRWHEVAFVHDGPTRPNGEAGEPLFVHRCGDKFRLKAETFGEGQFPAAPRYVASLPLEMKCWQWLSELTQKLDAAHEPHRHLVPRKVVRVGLPDQFNCSLIEHDGRLLLASRHGEVAARICLSELDDAWQPRWTRTLAIDHPAASGGVEDPRLFVHKGRLHCSFIALDDRGSSRAIHQMFCRIRDDGRVHAVTLPSYVDRLPFEKNWQFFEHRGELHSVYSIRPQIVLRHRGSRATRVAETECRIDFGDHHLRGGAPPVRVGGEYYHFFHTMRERGGQFEYALGVYTFAARPPFAVRRAAREPIFRAAEYDRTPGYNKSVVFPCGAVRRGDEWLISYGYHDRECRIASFSAASIERMLRPVR